MEGSLDSRFLERLSTGDIFQQHIECFAKEVDWDSALFDELSDLVDVDDLLEDGKDERYEPNLDNLDIDLDLMPWNAFPLEDKNAYGSAENVKPEPQSPASSNYSVPSPMSVDSVSSTQHVPEELDLTSSQMSPVSLYADHPKPCSSPELPVKVERPSRNTPKVAVKAHVKQRKLAPVVPKPTVQLKSILVPAGCNAQTISGISPKAILLQPLTTFLPKQQPVVSFHAAPTRGQPVLLAPSAVVQLQTPAVVAAPPVVASTGGPLKFPNHPVNVLAPAGSDPAPSNVPSAQPNIQTTVRNSSTDINVIRRQERMIKNRESAFQSRRKKKEYMQAMESRLRAALAENEKLKKENGSLQKLLEDMEAENIRLKVTAPKRRTVCLMIVVAFVMLNFSPFSLFEKDPSTFPGRGGPVHHNRHLLGFSPGEEQNRDQNVPVNIGYEQSVSNDKALMVVKEEALIYIPQPPPPCQPQVNRTESRRLAQELRGWVHRHEVERTKSRRMSNHQSKTRVVQKTQEKSNEQSQLVTMQYSDMSVKNPGNELQVYYASPRSYQDFLEALRRRGDTFYVVSFRRDHLLLPATNRNKTTRPKMSIVLPAMNINENVINGQDYEVMMQIDCEVMDTRILHIKASSIPPFLREHKENLTNTFYSPSAAAPKAAHVVNAITESAL
ncbi:cyclic AMP-dependent transcription factor ATF-6 alpha [Ambystoma mexicanum]|uniref:cyclic AMP-dependent transcription factor ATF-6 alpha n=1 Tax=Ambystoma mexicanum TaxID=8296 RepID=UPI0037E76B4C